MRASYQPRRASSRRLESPFSWGFLGVLLLALKLLLPTCSGSCGAPPRFTSMRPKHDLTPPVNDHVTVEYKCNQGFKLIVPSVTPNTSCQPDGSYAPPLQEGCIEMYCPRLHVPPHGKLVSQNEKYTFGTKVYYVCVEGYYARGPLFIECQETGEDNLVWNEHPPSCEKIVCRPPPPISNGKFTASKKKIYEYNDTAVYSCDKRYMLVGESKLVCTGYYKWSAPAPKCEDDPKASNESPTRADDLDGGLIAVIVLTVLAVNAVVGTCV